MWQDIFPSEIEQIKERAARVRHLTPDQKFQRVLMLRQLAEEIQRSLPFDLREKQMRAISNREKKDHATLRKWLTEISHE